MPEQIGREGNKRKKNVISINPIVRLNRDKIKLHVVDLHIPVLYKSPPTGCVKFN